MTKNFFLKKKIHLNVGGSGLYIRGIISGMEVYEITGSPFSSLQNVWKSKKYIYEAIFIGLNMERKELYRRIDKRVDKMFEKGLVEEVKRLINKGYENCRSVLKAVGYKEVLKYLKGDTTIENCTGEVKRNTRRLAKKQMNWFNSEPKINWIRVDNYDK